MDNVDKNVTHRLTRSGEVDTARPTNDSSPITIKYIVSDRAGNKRTALRLVNLICPAKEKRCNDTGSGFSCSKGGVCGSGEAESTLVSSTQSKPNVRPTIRLIGADVVQVFKDDVYAKCSATAALSDACDRGATASDPEDGAAPLTRAAPSPASRPQHAACLEHTQPDQAPCSLPAAAPIADAAASFSPRRPPVQAT